MIDDIDKEVQSGHAELHEPSYAANHENIDVDNEAMRTNTPPVKSAKRRKTRGGGDGLVESLTETMNKFSDMLSENMSYIAKCFQNESERQQRKMQIFDELKKLERLTQDQLLRVAQILCQNRDQTDLFFSLDDEHKFAFIQMLLE